MMSPDGICLSYQALTALLLSYFPLLPADEALSPRAGPDCTHERLHCAIRSRQVRILAQHLVLGLAQLRFSSVFATPILFYYTSAKLARQAQSKEKVLKKMVDAGLTDKVEKDAILNFDFPDCGTVSSLCFA